MELDMSKLYRMSAPYAAEWLGRPGTLRTYNMDRDLLAGLRVSCIEWMDDSFEAEVTLHRGDGCSMSDYFVYHRETVRLDQAKGLVSELVNNSHKYICKRGTQS